jgi:hypothetical protein
MKRHVMLFESFPDDQQDQDQDQDMEFIVGSVIALDGEHNEDYEIATDYKEGLNRMIEMIEGFRPEFEREKQGDSHWKMYEQCVFFLGKKPKGLEPELESGSRGEILIEGVDLIEEVELTIYSDHDFDAIVSDLRSGTRFTMPKYKGFKSRLSKARNLFGV